MRTLISLVGSLLRGGGRRTILDLSLTVVGVAIPVAVVILVVGTVMGFRERENAMAWREPTVVEMQQATALQRRSYQPLEGERIDVVELKALHSDLPIPPGLERFPSDGEIWVSPGLAKMLETGLFTEILEQRLDGRVVGFLGKSALAYSEELVAVVGDSTLEATPSSELLPFDHRVVDGSVPSDVLPIRGFAEKGTDPGLPQQYMVAALIAGTLLVAPSITLLGAGARLTAARRGCRLAALRLAGATSSQVLGLAALETGFAAVIGSGLGLATAMAGIAILSGIPLGGGPFSPAELLPEGTMLVALLVGALLVAVVSALVGLRSARTTPLGVVRQGRRRRPGLVRFLLLVLSWAGFIAMVPLAQANGGEWLLVAGLAMVILNISLAGPLFAWLMGWIVVRLSRRPRGMVAGRRLKADPVGSFRPTTGIILVAFVAGFLLLTSATLPESSELEGGLILANPTMGVDPDIASSWRAKLSELYPEAVFTESDDGLPVIELSPEMDTETERGRIEKVTGWVPLTSNEADYEDLLFAGDVRMATGIMVIIALIQAAVATGVGATASVLEQANTLAALHLAGTPRSQLVGARLVQAAIPITTGAAICVIFGVLAGSLTMIGVGAGSAVVMPSILQATLVVVGAALAAVAGTALSNPVLSSVLRRPLTER